MGVDFRNGFDKLVKFFIADEKILTQSVLKLQSSFQYFCDQTPLMIS